VLHESLTGLTAVVSVFLSGLILEASGSWRVVHNYSAIAMALVAIVTTPWMNPTAKGSLPTKNEVV
jgi:hypothetical protein